MPAVSANRASQEPQRLRVVVSPKGDTANWLDEHLDKSRFTVVSCASGVEFLQCVQREKPRIAVLDRVSERREAAEMELAILKEFSPDVRIIAISERQTPDDAWLAERGVFFYMTLPPGPELLRVVDAAARSTHSTREPRS